jgi:CubicO group peptidase (beta-lactamase class C family)
MKSGKYEIGKLTISASPSYEWSIPVILHYHVWTGGIFCINDYLVYFKTINIMKKIKYVLISIGVFGFLISCKQTSNTEIRQAEFLNNKHYVSIDGLWRCTPETALQFPNGTLEPIIKISGDIYNKLTVQGCFLWDELFYDYWELIDIQFNDSTNQLTIVDSNGSTFVGIIDQKKQKIPGMVYSGYPDIPVPEDKLDFVRAEEIDASRLFIPWPPRLNGSITYTYHQPEQINDYLQTASVFQFIKDSSAFFNLMEQVIHQEFGRIESLLILKDNKLIVEEYFYGYDRTQIHNIHSCTKSITSLLLGMVLEHHKNIKVDQPLFSFFPQYDSLKTEEKAQITLKHVLTMTAGFQEEESLEDHEPDDQLHYILSLPLETKPGETFEYSNNGSDLLGVVINSLEGKQANIYAVENLFNPLGISKYYWETENGLLHCHSDLYLLPRDMAKIGLMVLNDGKWQNKQLVSEEWIRESTKPHVPESKFFDYGYQWWHRSKQNKSWWRDPVQGSKNEHDMFLAMGYGGQYIMVIRDLNMVIVTTSSDYNEDNGMGHQKVPMVIEEIIPAITNTR